MHSSSKIIKSTVISSNAVISSPAANMLINRAIEENYENDSSKNVIEMFEKEIERKKNEVLNDAVKKADEIIQQADLEASDIKQNACEDGYQEGFKVGYSEGYNHGINEANSEAQSIRNAAKDLLTSCHEETRKYIKDSEKEIINLSIEIAKQIIGIETSVNPDAVFKIAEKVISRAVERKQVVLRVNPDDFNIVKGRKDELSMYVEDSSNIVVIADPKIPRGGITAETPSGFVDGKIDTQLQTIMKKLCGE